MEKIHITLVCIFVLNAILAMIVWIIVMFFVYIW